MLGPSPSIGAGLSTCQIRLRYSPAISQLPRKPMLDVPEVMRKRRWWLMPEYDPFETCVASLKVPGGVAPNVPTLSKNGMSVP